MIASVAFPFSIFPSKSGNVRSSLIRETKFTHTKDAAIQSLRAEEYNNIMCSIPVQKSSDTHHILFKHYKLQHAVKKIRTIMARKTSDDDGLQELIMVDAIQRLGLQHYFQEEIHAALERHHKKCCSFEQKGVELHEVALRFRLLRQGGYYVNVDAFNKFKTMEGKLKQQHYKDIKGLLSLFEASQLSIEGENVLDQDGDVSEELLRALLTMNILEQSKARMIENTLRTPFHKSLARVLSRSILQDFKPFLENVHDLTSARYWVKDIQDLARVDIDMAQTTHRNEILQISRWGKELNLTKKLHFARIQPFKWYIWSLGTLPGPNMGEERIELAKPVSFIYMIDDIFDVYGTLDELSAFTQAANSRWEDADIEKLPDYMKVCFKALRDMVKDISLKTRIKYGCNPEDLLRRAWGDLCNSFLMEAKWLASGDLPSSEEYLKNGIISAGVPVVLMHAFFLLGHGISNKSVDAWNDLPSVVSSSATIVRLWNDVGTDKDENRDGKDGSYIDCYRKEHNNVVSTKSARQHVKLMISNAWKRLNEEFLSQASPFSADFKEACLNFARMSSIMYSLDESDHLLDLQKHLNLSLVDTLS